MLHPDSFSLCVALSLSFFLSGMALPCQSHEGKQMSSLWQLPPFLEKLPRSAERRSQWKQREVKLDMETCPKTPGNAAETALAKIKMEPHPLRIGTGSILLPTNLQHSKKITEQAGQGFSSLQVAVDTWRMQGPVGIEFRSCTIPNASLKGQRPIDVNGWKNLSRH